MNFKALLIIVIVISVSACAHRSTDIGPTPNEAAVISDAIDTDTDDAIKHAKSGAEEAISSKQAIEKTDLLERIRQGFEFPDFKSKIVRDQERWNSQHKTFLNNLFTRATPFLFHIVEEIEKRGLPTELALLAAVESSYKPNAVSRSNAVGLWQFTSPTGREYGLRQDWWYDGRRDVLASTDAALEYLTRLNKRYDGDWFLSLAAYNAGPGTVSRAMKSNLRKGKGTRYQDLTLRLETRRYIPKLIALKNILNNPEKFGVVLPKMANEAHFKVVPLKGQIDLQKFAHDAGIKRGELQNLNAGFKRWATSPKGPHRLLIPINANGNVNHAEVAVQRAPAINYQNHRIAHGDSLSTISRKYGVTISALRNSNNIKGNNIRAGKDLLIPVRNKTQTAVAVNQVASTNNVKLNSRNIPNSHTVKKGDTLWSISRFYNINLSNLLSWNKLPKNHILSLNQSIKLIQN